MLISIYIMTILITFPLMLLCWITVFYVDDIFYNLCYNTNQMHNYQKARDNLQNGLSIQSFLVILGLTFLMTIIPIGNLILTWKLITKMGDIEGE